MTDIYGSIYLRDLVTSVSHIVHGKAVLSYVEVYFIKSCVIILGRSTGVSSIDS